MISPTLTHLLRSPYWWLTYLAVLVAVFSGFTAITSQIDLIKRISAIFLLAAVGYFNYIMFGLILSEKLRIRFLRNDADWTGWHSVDIGMGAFVGLMSLFGSIIVMVRIVTGAG